MIIPFQSLRFSSEGMFLVTLLSTSVKSWHLILSIVLDIIHYPKEQALTDTKKLEVPSTREKVSGNNFSQVSSPYMTSFPPRLSFN